MIRNALIVGSAGQDGTLLTQLLAQRGYAVVGLRRGDVDLLAPHAVRDFINDLKPDEIYYLAAFHHSSENLPPSSGALFRQSMDVHFYGVVNVLDALVGVAPGSRLFFASSSHIFGEADHGMQTEDTPYDPQSEYAISKVAGMQACQRYRRAHHAFVSIGILYNHESPLRHHDFLSKKIAVAAARIATSGRGTLELGDLEAQIDWGYAMDYVDAMYRILQLETPSDYIIATGTLHTVREFVDVAFRYVGLDYRKYVVCKDKRALRSNNPRVGDFSKLQRDTQWVPSMNFQQMVAALVQYEMNAISDLS